MWRLLLIPLALPLFVGMPLSAACPCLIQFGVCDEARQSNAVFIGTVEAVAPPFLDPFARSGLMGSIPAAEAARLQADSSPDAFEKLKRIYLDMFKGLPDRAREQILSSHTRQELQTAFETLQSEGRVARFRVRTQFKRSSDDDDNDKPARSEEAPESVDVWTGSGDCGIDFQVGETYLVYAIEDEDSGRLETSVCMRTRRLSEEKGDLAYLYFLQNSEKESTRLEGFVSASFADQNLPRYEDSVSMPVPGTILELDSGDGRRYTQSNAEGRYSFDGLKAGDYRVSVLAPGFPRTPRTVLLSRPLHADQTSCARQIFVIPARPPGQLSQ